MFDNRQRAFLAISGQEEICFPPGMANRHGLITGATGTGKTVTLQTLAETFSQMGVPVFASDVKGDLSGVAAPGGNKESVIKRVAEYRLEEKGFRFQAFPVQFWDVFGEAGVPVRAAIGDMGPLLLSRLLGLNDTQNAVLTVLFKMAEEEGLDLVDIKDLSKLLEYASHNGDSLAPRYGAMSRASLGPIQRALIALEQAGADRFFGEPVLNIDDLIQTRDGKGVINILSSDKLMNSPTVYSIFLLWLMTRLFEALPEAGDMDKPKLVFFFDEARLLFDNAPKVLVEKVEQVVRLIRSRGVGMYFLSQSPSDIPDSVLGQLGNKVQHALRAYTPKDQKALKAAARSFRANPAFDTETAIAELGTGEALISFLDAKGAPVPVKRAFILPPQGQVGPIGPEQRLGTYRESLLYRYYGERKDRETAYEKLDERLAGQISPRERAAREKAEARARKEGEKQAERMRREEEKQRKEQERQVQKEAEAKKRLITSTAKSVFVPLARDFLKSVFKGMVGKK